VRRGRWRDEQEKKVAGARTQTRVVTCVAGETGIFIIIILMNGKSKVSAKI
jgi:hypothetical protein